MSHRPFLKIVLVVGLVLLPAARILKAGSGAQAGPPAKPLSGGLPPNFAAGAIAMPWSTFLGGAWDDQPYATAVDANGSIYVAGYSLATWGAPIRSWSGGFVDAYVAKLSSSGVLQWNTFLGGSTADHGYGIAVDGAGNVYVTGWSDGTWGAPLNPFAGEEDVFIAKLNTNGVLQWNTFLGGPGYEEGWAVFVDAVGNIYLAGGTYETWGSPMAPYAGGEDGFVAKLNNLGTVVWNTFMGGAGNDSLRSLAVSAAGSAYVAGFSDMTWGSPVRSFSSGYFDAFAAKIYSTGGLEWNTFLGSSDWDEAYGIALDSGSNAYVTGWSNADWGTPVRAFDVGPDGFAVKLSPSGALSWNTFLGGSSDDLAYAAAVDSGGTLYVAGESLGTWGSPAIPFSSNYDAFAARVGGDGALLWNAFLGGSDSDLGRTMALDATGNIYVVGKSSATWGSPVRPYTANIDTFVAKIVQEPPLWAARHAAGDFDGDGADELAIDFGASGAWMWNAGAWSQLTPVNPESLLTAWVEGGQPDQLVADLGALGVWQWGGGAWTQLSGVNAESLAVIDDDADGNREVLGDFGPAGLWYWSGTSWTQLSGVNADYAMGMDYDGNGSDDVIGDFGPTGLWLYNHDTWTQLSGVNADYVTVADFTDDGISESLVGDFGPTGLWKWTISAWPPYNPLTATWTQLSGVNADYVVVGNPDPAAGEEIIGDFGLTGLWVWTGGTWSILSGVNAEYFVWTDIDGNWVDEIAVDFGAMGLWFWDAGAWTQISGVNPEYLMIADVDGDDKYELLADFGTLGLWVWNDAVWTQISANNPE